MRSLGPLRLLASAWRSPRSTVDWPFETVSREGPEAGPPVVSAEECDGCGDCVRACPTGCIEARGEGSPPVVDLGGCVCCGECERACGAGAVHLGPLGAMAVHDRSDLVMDGAPAAEVDVGPPPGRLLRQAIHGTPRREVTPAELLRSRMRSLGRDGDE